MKPYIEPQRGEQRYTYKGLELENFVSHYHMWSVTFISTNYLWCDLYN